MALRTILGGQSAVGKPKRKVRQGFASAASSTGGTEAPAAPAAPAASSKVTTVNGQPTVGGVQFASGGKRVRPRVEKPRPLKQAIRSFDRQAAGYRKEHGRIGVRGGKATGGPSVNDSASSSRRGMAMQEFTRGGDRYHVYFHKGKRLVFRVGKAKQAGTGGTPAP